MGASAEMLYSQLMSNSMAATTTNGGTYYWDSGGMHNVNFGPNIALAKTVKLKAATPNLEWLETRVKEMRVRL